MIHLKGHGANEMSSIRCDLLSMRRHRLRRRARNLQADPNAPRRPKRSHQQRRTRFQVEIRPRGTHAFLSRLSRHNLFLNPVPFH